MLGNNQPQILSGLTQQKHFSPQLPVQCELAGVSVHLSYSGLVVTSSQNCCHHCCLRGWRTL